MKWKSIIDRPETEPLQLLGWHLQYLCIVGGRSTKFSSVPLLSHPLLLWQSTCADNSRILGTFDLEHLGQRRMNDVQRFTATA